MGRLLKEILLFSGSKNGLRNRAFCLLQGLCFFPFLFASRTGQGKDVSAMESSGIQDDIYPLF